MKPRELQRWSNKNTNASRDGASTASLCKLFQCLTAKLRALAPKSLGQLGQVISEGPFQQNRSILKHCLELYWCLYLEEMLKTQLDMVVARQLQLTLLGQGCIQKLKGSLPTPAMLRFTDSKLQKGIVIKPHQIRCLFLYVLPDISVIYQSSIIICHSPIQILNLYASLTFLFLHPNNKA